MPTCQQLCCKLFHPPHAQLDYSFAPSFISVEPGLLWQTLSARWVDTFESHYICLLWSTNRKVPMTLHRARSEPYSGSKQMHHACRDVPARRHAATGKLVRGSLVAPLPLTLSLMLLRIERPTRSGKAPRQHGRADVHLDLGGLKILASLHLLLA